MECLNSSGGIYEDTEIRKKMKVQLRGGKIELSQVVGVVEGKMVHSHSPEQQKVGLRRRRVGCKQDRERKVNLGNPVK